MNTDLIFSQAEQVFLWPDGGGTTVYPLDGERRCASGDGRDARLRWSSDCRFLVHVDFQRGRDPLFRRKDLRITVAAEPATGEIPASGFQTEADVRALPGVTIIEATDVAPGPTSSVYAFSRETTQRNLYRIPVP